MEINENQFQSILENAENGDVEAQVKAGMMYQRNSDYEKAVYWYEKAASKGNPEAQCKLGGMFDDGIGVEENITKAYYLYRSAASKGNEDAIFQLGNMYYEGRGTPVDYDEALACFREISHTSGAMYCLGDMYKLGRGVYKNYVIAFEWYMKSAQRGYCLAQYWVARMYMAGFGTNKDLRKAFDWFCKAATGGHSLSQFIVGLFFYGGFDSFVIPIDHVAALNWFTKFYEKTTEPLGAMCIADIYRRGLEVKKDYAIALKWYKKASRIVYNEVSVIDLENRIYDELKNLDGEKSCVNPYLMENYEQALGLNINRQEKYEISRKLQNGIEEVWICQAFSKMS